MDSEKYIIDLVKFTEVIPQPNQYIIEDSGVIQFDDGIIYYTIEIMN